MTEPSQDGAKKGFSLGRLVPILVLLAGLGVFFALGWHKYISFEVLQENRQNLLDLVAQYGVLAGIGFIAVYALATAFSIPGGAILTITAGFLFGPFIGSVCAVVGATIGATALFLAGPALARSRSAKA